MRQLELPEVINDHLEEVDRTRPCDCWMKNNYCYCRKTIDNETNRD